jgi:hypothetical protein
MGAAKATVAGPDLYANLHLPNGTPRCGWRLDDHVEPLDLVGLGGLEPPTSSLSVPGKHGSPDREPAIAWQPQSAG